MNISIIYLAAGNSRRFGSNKLLYKYHGKPLYRHGLDTILELQKEYNNINLVVVTQYQEIYEQLKQEQIPAVLDESCKLGISYSIRAGIRYYTKGYGEMQDTIHDKVILSDEDYIMFCVADQPHLSKQTLADLIACADDKTETASVMYHDRPGNPTLFSAKLIPELLKLEEDQGGRAVIRRYSCQYVPVKEEKELIDFDTIDDLRADL